MRSFAVIRFSKKILSVMEDMFLDCRMYAPPAEVTGNSSIDWGVASCCREGVPDIIYDGGELGKEVFIRIFGENPIDVANNIIICSNRILHMEL
jgi:hydroxymethylpyrimidine/phosphomethylpyrimidine kinase